MVKIGAKPFNEQKIIANLIGKYLKDSYDVIISDPLPEANFLNLKGGKVNIIVDYLGTLYNTVFHIENPDFWNKEMVTKKIIDKLKIYNLNLVSFLGFSNDFVFLSKKFFAKNLTNLSITSYKFSFACPAPFIERSDGLPLLINRYNLKFKNILPTGVDKIYEYLIENKVDIIVGFKTDSKIEKFSLYTIEDDKKVLPPYDAIIISKNLSFEKNKKLKNFKITEEKIRHLNYLVDFENILPESIDL